MYVFFLIIIIRVRERVRVNSDGAWSLGDPFNKETIGQYVKKLL